MPLRNLSTFDRTKYHHLANYEQFVLSLGIPGYKFYIGQHSKQLKVRSLTGPERLKVLKHIKIHQLLPTLDETAVLKIRMLWVELLRLNERFSKRPEDVSEEEIITFECDAKEWVRNFLDTYHRDHVTPYIHAMANHVGQFMRIHGVILPFTQQGLEKHNDMTKQFFHATCH